MKYSRDGLSREDRKGILVFIAGVVVLAALLAIAVKTITSPDNDYDRVTLCNESIRRYAHNLLIIDVSDTLSEYQERFLRSHISGLLESSQINDRFTIFALDEKYNGLSDPVVDVCQPQSAGDADMLTSNRAFIEKLYRDRFASPLESAITSVVSAGDQDISPIYEALADIAALNRIDRHAEEVNVTIISDMIQNSKTASVFSSGSEAIESLPSIDLNRARTTVFWLDRDKYRQYQTTALVRSWEDYLASVSRFEQIQRVRN